MWNMLKFRGKCIWRDRSGWIRVISPLAFVIFYLTVIDTNAQTEAQAGGTREEREVQVAAKTKRRIIKPAYLNDYV